MAGYYPDPPAQRFAIDEDGAKLYYYNEADPAGTLAEIANSNIVTMSSEDATYYNFGSGSTNTSYSFVLMFPEKRNIRGMYYNVENPSISGAVYSFSGLLYSTDTTDGIDGTWTTLGHPSNSFAGLSDKWRTDVHFTFADDVRAIRARYARNSDASTTGLYFREWHIYGHVPVAQNPNRLVFWDPTVDMEVGGGHFDWGDLEQSEVGAPITFRVHNNSSTQTANTITVSVQDLTSGTVMGTGLELSTDDVTYSATLNLGNLAAGATSAVLYARKTVGAADAAGAYAARFKASASSWT